MTSFLLQPLQAEASEEGVEESPVQVTDELIERVSTVDTAPLTEVTVDEPVVDEEVAEEQVSTTATMDEATSTPPDTDELPAEEVATTTDTTSTSTSSESVPQPETETLPSEETSEEVTPVIPNDIPTTTESDLLSEQPTTTPSQLILTVESDQMLQFNKSACVLVADGSYYCQPGTSHQTSVQSDALVALPDSDGDLEIFLQRDGEMTQLTFNIVDDASPQYDPASDTIVWHRMVNERYQIIVYDVSSGEEFQLTDTSGNSMEPYRADNFITWQYWVDGAWQVMLYDGEEVKQLTDTEAHNIAPKLRNGLVVWHRVAGSENQTIEVYDLTSRTYMSIKGESGESVSNPRMVLVFESKTEGGEVVTKGYDLVTGEVTTFASTPGELPDDIPDPDRTGETRALIQNKHQEDDSELLEPTPVGGGTSPFGTSATTTASTTVTSDLVLDLSTSTDQALVPEYATSSPFDLVIDPLVMPPEAITSTTTSP